MGSSDLCSPSVLFWRIKMILKCVEPATVIIKILAIKWSFSFVYENMEFCDVKSITIIVPTCKINLQHLVLLSW